MTRIHKIPPASHTTLLMPMLSAVLLVWKVHQNGAMSSESWLGCLQILGQSFIRPRRTTKKSGLTAQVTPLNFGLSTGWSGFKFMITAHPNPPKPGTLTGPGSFRTPGAPTKIGAADLDMCPSSKSTIHFPDHSEPQLDTAWWMRWTWAGCHLKLHPALRFHGLTSHFCAPLASKNHGTTSMDLLETPNSSAIQSHGGEIPGVHPPRNGGDGEITPGCATGSKGCRPFLPSAG